MKRQLQTSSLVGLSALLVAVAIAPASSAQATRDTLGRESIVTPPSRSLRPAFGPLSQGAPGAAAMSTTGVTLSPSQFQAETELVAELGPVEQEALRSETDLTTRLAREFGMTARQLERQRSTFGATWSDLLIAHTLAANSRGRLTVARFFELLERGQSWSTIATSLGFNLSQLVSAVRHEALVATGMMRPDGRVQSIAGGTTTVSTSARTSAKIIRGSGATVVAR